MRTLHLTATATVLALVGALIPGVSFAAEPTPAPAAPTVAAATTEAVDDGHGHEASAAGRFVDDAVAVPAKYDIVREKEEVPDGFAAAVSPALHTVNVAVVTPPGTTAPTMTDAQIDAHLATLSGYWVDQTDGMIGTIVRSDNIQRYTTAYTCSDISNGIWTEAAGKFGFNKSHYYTPFNHLLVIGPSGCGSAGLGSLMNPSIENGGLLWTQDAYAYMDILTHEFGHNVGLNHANAYLCGNPQNASDTRAAGDCTIREYFDTPDVMGAAWTIGNSVSEVSTSLNSPNRESLGVLDNGEQVEVALFGDDNHEKVSHTISDIGLSTGKRSVKVTDPISGTQYYVEFRNRNGSDAKSLFGMDLTRWTTPRGFPGVRVLATTGGTTLNFATAEPNTGNHQLIIPVGQKFTSDSGLATVKVTATGNTTAIVEVEVMTEAYKLIAEFSQFITYASAPNEIIGKNDTGLVKLTPEQAAAVPVDQIVKRSSQFMQDPNGNIYKVVWETVTKLTTTEWGYEGSPTPKQVTRAPALEYYSYASAPSEIITRTPLGWFRHANDAEYLSVTSDQITRWTSTYFIRNVGDPQIYKETNSVSTPISNETWVNEGSPTPMVPATAPVGTNPFSLSGPYVDPNYPSVAAASQLRKDGRDADAAQVDKISAYAGSLWVGDWEGMAKVQPIVDKYITSALATGQTGVLVPYAIPGRSCGSHSAGGFATDAEYRQFIDNVAAGINGRSVAVILEPDAVLQLDRCKEMEGDRRGLLKYASATLTAAGGTVYIDAGSSNAGTPADMSVKLLDVGIENVRGFTMNVANFLGTDAVRTYAEELSTLLGGKSYVIDTSRNGIPKTGEWCNTQGAALGAIPGKTAFGNQDANLWIKTVGASDGPCYGGPSAGMWWNTYAIDIAKRTTAIPAASTSPTAMISTWNVGATPGGTITLPLANAVDATVYWGDGTSTKVTSPYPSHTYTGDAAKGITRITIDGKFAKWGGKVWSSDSLLQIGKWGSTSTMSLEHGFYNASNLTHIVGIPSGIWNLSHAFDGVTGYQETIDWNMNAVSDISWMFASSDYSRPVSHWNVSKVKNYSGTFAGTKAFNSPLDSWDTVSATGFSGMFLNSKAYNQPVGSWNTANVANFSRMFENAPLFNQPVKTWNTAKATNINSMFKGATRFNQNLSTWDVSKVTNFNHLFNSAFSFNQPLGTWDTSSATKMAFTFKGAKLYNQGMTTWNTANVTTMDYMFYGATVMNKDIRSWNTSKVTSRDQFSAGSPLLAPTFK